MSAVAPATRPRRSPGWLRSSASTLVRMSWTSRAGTGKLSRELRASGAEVIAVEPLARMRELIEPPIHALEGSAERIPLPDGSADAVTVAQAFHSFDGETALAEIHGVLRPAGHLALVWNVRLLEDPGQAAVEELIAPYTGEIPRHRSGEWRARSRPQSSSARSRSGASQSAAPGRRRSRRPRRLHQRDRGARPGRNGKGCCRGSAASLRTGPLALRYRCEIQVARREP